MDNNSDDDEETPPHTPSTTIPPPYLWAGNQRCSVRTVAYLHAHDIFFVSGEVWCIKCQGISIVTHHLKDKFEKMCDFVSYIKEGPPSAWILRPALANCKLCKQEQIARPVFSEKKRNINWLFLFLGQMLGSCTTLQLRYFCKHTGGYPAASGPNERILRLAYSYSQLCRQLDPDKDL